VNCFCELGDEGVENTANACESKLCPKHFKPSFNVLGWRDQICLQGVMSEYSQSGYNNYMGMVHGVRVAIPILIIIVALVAAGCITRAFLDDYVEDVCVFGIVFLVVFFATAGLLSLAILPPIYVAI
jgi:hypothetical protein